MKHLRLFENTENWSLSKIEGIHDDLDKMKDLIFEYLILNNLIQVEEKRSYYYVLEFWLDEEEDIFFSVKIKNIIRKKDKEFDYDFTKQQFNDLLIFMNDPEIYKNTKKYNL
jgi:hypothetical protein